MAPKKAPPKDSKAAEKQKVSKKTTADSKAEENRRQTTAGRLETKKQGEEESLAATKVRAGPPVQGARCILMQSG